MDARIMVEFDLILENIKLKEDLGIESLHSSKCTFNLASVDYFRESFDGEGEIEPYTVVVLDTGILLTLNITYAEFKNFYTKKIKNE